MAARFGAPFDRDGTLAAAASADEELVQALLGDPYFDAPPPKSTGRDLFTLEWVERNARVARLDAAVVLASLTELTARAVGQAIERWLPSAADVVVCGGGSRNRALLQALQRCVGPRPVLQSDALGIPADQVEALAFAWLAHCHVERRPANLPRATGARGARVLGALYPAAA
jgi:anhydro-N-acetylmuramic acid kinase